MDFAVGAQTCCCADTVTRVHFEGLDRVPPPEPGPCAPVPNCALTRLNAPRCWGATSHFSKPQPHVHLASHRVLRSMSYETGYIFITSNNVFNIFDGLPDTLFTLNACATFIYIKSLNTNLYINRHSGSYTYTHDVFTCPDISFLLLGDLVQPLNSSTSSPFGISVWRHLRVRCEQTRALLSRPAAGLSQGARVRVRRGWPRVNSVCTLTAGLRL